MNKKQFYIITSVLFFLVAKVITHKSRVTKSNHKSNVRIA